MRVPILNGLNTAKSMALIQAAPAPGLYTSLGKRFYNCSTLATHNAARARFADGRELTGRRLVQSSASRLKSRLLNSLARGMRKERRWKVNNRKITPLDAVIILCVALMISALIWIVKSYTALPEPPKNQCWYEVKYLHVSGREITKRVYMTCQGFYPWFEDPQLYKVPTMVLPFSDGNEVIIQGATDILSVAKIKDDE